MVKKTLAYGLEGLDNYIAEILFVDPNVTVEEAVRVSRIYRSGKNIDGLLTLLQKSFNSTINYYGKFGSKDKQEVEELSDKVQEKLRLWTSAFRAPELFELLKINEYFHIPLSVLTGKPIPNAALLSEVLDQYVIDQKDYTSALALAFHIHRLKYVEEESGGCIDLPKTTLLCAGASGSGKSLALQVLQRLFSIPVETVHCNTLVSEGIIGSVLSDALTNVYMKCNLNLSKVEHSVIHLDEFDKLFTEDGVYNKRIVHELLNLIDDNSTVSFKDSFERNPSTLRVSTKNIMFVFSGVFSGLPEIVEKRINTGSSRIGFNVNRTSAMTTDKLYSAATHEDYMAYGIKTEVMGRISNLTSVKELGVDSIYRILLNRANSPFVPFQKYFTLHGIQLEMTDDAAFQIAEHVVERKLGARGIRQVLQTLLQPYMFSLNVPNQTLMLDSRFVKTKFK